MAYQGDIIIVNSNVANSSKERKYYELDKFLSRRIYQLNHYQIILNVMTDEIYPEHLRIISHCCCIFFIRAASFITKTVHSINYFKDLFYNAPGA